MMAEVAENIADIRRKLARTAKGGGYPVPTLIAVSKQQPEDKIDAALDAGQRVFGENRVQEAEERWTRRRAEYPDLTLHLIGPLQTNKVKDAVALFDVIETIDNEKLASHVKAEIDRQGRAVQCLIQVNTGQEIQKSGINVDGLHDLLRYCRDIGLRIEGLMCIPPLNDPSALHFALLKTLAKDAGLQHLSMGMSGDYEKALMLGATMIRIGTGVFGQRITR